MPRCSARSRHTSPRRLWSSRGLATLPCSTELGPACMSVVCHLGACLFPFQQGHECRCRDAVDGTAHAGDLLGTGKSALMDVLTDGLLGDAQQLSGPLRRGPLRRVPAELTVDHSSSSTRDTERPMPGL